MQAACPIRFADDAFGIIAVTIKVEVGAYGFNAARFEFLSEFLRS